MNRTPHDWDDAKLGRLIGASRASSPSGTLARVRERLALRTASPRWVAWFARPAALGLSAVLLVLSVVAGNALLRDDRLRDDDTLLVTAMLGDDGSLGLAGPVSATGSDVADSGGVTP